jgi:4-diphosphocytidyl-2-C-methyl-D-erythritol kinase
LWKIDKSDGQIYDIARLLGADVPACLASSTQFGDGKGDHPVEADIAPLGGTPLLLVNPRIALSTAAVFAGWDGVDRGGLNPQDPLYGRNDLTAAAISIVPAIATILGRLETLPHVRIARMSGSGATCFALFETLGARDAGESIIRSEMPDLWCLATTLR